MNVQLVRRLEGAFKVHLVEDGSLTAICGATSTSGWDVAPPEEGATCPACQARLTTLRQPMNVLPLSGPGAPMMQAPIEPPPEQPPYVDPRGYSGERPYG